jgi:hypothetical protein
MNHVAYEKRENTMRPVFVVTMDVDTTMGGQHLEHLQFRFILCRVWVTEFHP